MTDEDQPRLARIESKLDSLAEAVVGLARIEERVASVLTRIDRADAGRDDDRRRIADLERQIDKRSGTLAAIERVFWIGATAGLTVWATNLIA